MDNYARIINDVAVDVSTDPAAQFHPDLAAEFVPVPEGVQQGWRRNGGEWSAPLPPATPEPGPALTWENAPAEYWWVDVGPFMDRFGSKALAITSSVDNVVQGLFKLMTGRAYVDLKRADLGQMLAILVTKELITAGDTARILETPTTDYERHVKGLPQPEDAE